MKRDFDLRARLPFEECDYVALKGALSGYKQIRDKITSLLKSGALVRVKKGLYVFGPPFSRAPYSKEILANLIYGPSYISLEYALGYYGMIPERVETLTSVTLKRDKDFQTPVGNFSYRYVNHKNYEIGVTRRSTSDGRYYFIATPEKALADKIVLRSPGLSLNAASDAESYLLDDLRCDPSSLKQLDLAILNTIVEAYGKINLRHVACYLEMIQI